MAYQTEFIKMFALFLVVIAIAVVVLRGLPTRWIESKDGDFRQTFLAHVGKQEDSVWTFAMKETLSRIVTAWWEKNCGGIIISGPENGEEQYQVIELEQGPYGPGKVDGIPMIKAKWCRAANQSQAKGMIRRHLKAETITCTEETYEVFMKHLKRCPVTNQTMNPNGQIVFEGYLSPVPK